MSKFKVGDMVTGTKSWQYIYGKTLEIERIGKLGDKDCYHIKGIFDCVWYEEELELVKSGQSEFTFEEVIARIKEGEVYQNSLSSISKIDGCIEVVSINRSGRTIPKGEEYIVRFETNNYKLVPKKNNYLLFVVEHKEGGKRYLFRSDLDHTLDDMVVCDTCQGKSYGKMIKVVTKELTEEEYKQYKPIVKIISKGCPF